MSLVRAPLDLTLGASRCVPVHFFVPARLGAPRCYRPAGGNLKLLRAQLGSPRACGTSTEPDRRCSGSSGRTGLAGATFESTRRGVDVDAEVSRMGDPVPPLFWFRDPDGDALMVVEGR
jgi:hypothetical protein